MNPDPPVLPLISALVALTPSGVIGRDGEMPWRLGSDLRRFKRLTLGHALLMGRKTFDSIGRPLPGRRNLVLSRDPHWRHEGVEVYGDLAAVWAAVGEAERLFVVGGAEIYRLCLPSCQRLLITRVDSQVEGDTHVPLDLTPFRCIHVEPVPQGPRDSVPTEFQIWERRSEEGRSEEGRSEIGTDREKSQ
jgi:dihydrofolate reductase